MKQLKKQYPRSTLNAKYEDLIENCQTEIEMVGKFLNLAKHKKKNSLDWTKLPKYQKMHSNVGKEPLKSRIKAWRKDLSWLEILAFEIEAKEELKRAGYKLVFPNWITDSRYVVNLTRDYFRA